jgi:hypothetical protein
MMTPLLANLIVDLYVNRKLTARDTYKQLADQGVTWREVRELLHEQNVVRKQGKTFKSLGRTYEPITCAGCDQHFTPKNSKQRYCGGCKPDQRLNTVLAHAYGLTREEYDRMLEKQKYTCAICTIPFTELRAKKTRDGRERRPTRVDHDHKTGRVRGLLCNTCNINLRGLEDEEWMKKALAYIHGG